MTGNRVHVIRRDGRPAVDGTLRRLETAGVHLWIEVWGTPGHALFLPMDTVEEVIDRGPQPPR